MVVVRVWQRCDGVGGRGWRRVMDKRAAVAGEEMEREAGRCLGDLVEDAAVVGGARPLVETRRKSLLDLLWVQRGLR